MKKTFTRFGNASASIALAAALCIALFACEKEPFTFNVTPESYNFAATGGVSSEITVSASQPWTALSNASWLIPSQTSGNGNGTFTMTATESLSTSERSAAITVTSGKITKTINVMQEGKENVPVSGVTLNKNSTILPINGTEQLTATVLPSNATNKNVTWSSNTSDATVSATGLITAKSIGSARIIVSTVDGNKTDTCTVNVIVISNRITGEIINGLRWATRNVENPGFFAANPEDAGMFYQWNRKIAWPATEDIIGWDATTPGGITWEKANDPCPTGWHVPTSNEIGKLLAADKVSSERTMINGVNGRKFTDKLATGNSIFLPAMGYRYNEDGTLYSAGAYGYYWSSSSYDSGNAYYLHFDNLNAVRSSLTQKRGFTVRCVADN